MKRLCCTILVALLLAFITQTSAERKSRRNPKLFSLFSVVTFKNGPCTSSLQVPGSGNNRNGTCFTTSECESRGGTISGNCAVGFGVCCVFILNSFSTAQTVTQNNTYIQNPGYPTAYNSTDDITYTIQRCSNDICTIRLDFEDFNVLGPIDLSENGVNANCQDNVRFTVPNTGRDPPAICGENTGQHLYLEIGNQPGDTAEIVFDFSATANTNRRYDILVTQIPCDATGRRPPDGCDQWFTSPSGRITTWNYNGDPTQHLSNIQQQVCIRQNENFCCVQYSVCNGEAMGFTLDTQGAAGAVNGITASMTNGECTLDYVNIESSTQMCTQNGIAPTQSRYCGKTFAFASGTFINSPVCDCTAPFVVGFVTDAMSDLVVPVGGVPTSFSNIFGGAAMTSRGVCLDYVSIPCT